LRTPIFRQLLIADVASDVGTFMQGVGAAWLMVSLGAGPMYVALTQTASTLPFFLLALPAGAIGDIVDRRKLILYTEAWMVCAAIALAVVVSGAGLDHLHLTRQRPRAEPGVGLGTSSRPRGLHAHLSGGMAAGSAVWGSVGARVSVETALLWAGLGTIASMSNRRARRQAVICSRSRRFWDQGG
jgi:MFS family permease